MIRPSKRPSALTKPRDSNATLSDCLGYTTMCDTVSGERLRSADRTASPKSIGSKPKRN
jgi:hypothetical protein